MHVIDDGLQLGDQSDEERVNDDQIDSGPPVEETYEESYEVPKVFWNWEVVTDWDKRIKAYDEKQMKFYN